MRIAVQGCSHGELDKIYDSVVQSESHTGKKVDLLICCGDFQACRNENDLKAMKVPKKHQKIASFWRYYSGEAVAPCLTIVIGGNHEASNYMWELYYGGWLAPRIYYLGSAGVVNVGGLRIGGLSGIYKKFDYHKGHHEVPPLSAPEIVSIFHVRSLETMRCKSITRPVDIFLSHDWPLGVYEFGNKEDLLRCKPFFEQDILSNELGSPPAAEILETVQPSYWFSGHLHVKFTAVIPHDNFGKNTRFLALDKCLPKRRFLQILDIGKELCSPPVLEYDEEWLAILHSTAKYFNPLNFDQKLPAHVQISDEVISECKTKFGSLIIPENFSITVPVHGENASPDKYTPSTNPQTRTFCAKLGIKNEVVPDESKEPALNELDITHDSEANMSRGFSLDFINDDPPANECTELLKDFSAPMLRTPALDQKGTPKCSTPLSKSTTPQSTTKKPVTLKRRLTLPEPKNQPETQLESSDGNVTPVPAIQKKADESVNECLTLDKGTELPSEGKDVQIINESILSKDAGNTDDSSSPKADKVVGTQPSTDSHIGDATQNRDLGSDVESVTSSANVTIDEDFNIDEPDDDLISKFLLLKKKFGRDQGSLSDSLLVNTSFNDPSIKDAIVCKKEEEKEIELGSSKKFKMQIHNDIDS